MSTNSAVLTVSQVNQTIKQMLEEVPTFRSLYVQGEISNYKAHSSGHRYFVSSKSPSVFCFWKDDAVF